jgi:hypothetical protein
MVDFDLESGIAVLERTPKVMRAWLQGLPDSWVFNNEGGESWSPFDVLGHFIHGELTPGKLIPSQVATLAGSTTTNSMSRPDEPTLALICRRKRPGTRGTARKRYPS